MLKSKFLTKKNIGKIGTKIFQSGRFHTLGTYGVLLQGVLLETNS
jgi:hypothetical protein